MAQQFRLELKSGPDKIRPYKEDASQVFKRGELIKVTDTTEVGALTGNSVATGVLGVAAADGQSSATPLNKAQVYVVTPEQTWEIHAASGVKPTAYSIGGNYKVKMKQTAVTNFAITREAETSSTTVSIRGPILAATTKVGSTSQGVVVIGYSDDATKDKKGQKLLVRFPSEATVNMST